jgi:hypothetical protein
LINTPEKIMTDHEKILADLFPESVKLRVKQEGLWDFRIESPVTLYDPPVIVVTVDFGNESTKKTGSETICLKIGGSNGSA